MRRIFYIAITFILGLTQSCFGGESLAGFDKEAFIESAKTPRILRIGLLDCIAYSLKNNSEIKIKRIEPEIKEDDIKIQKADFEPTFSFDYNLTDTASKSTRSALFSPAVSRSRTTEFNAGIDGKLVTGTEYELDLFNAKYKSNATYLTINPYYTTEPKITITQPLFRDFGIIVNKADIIIAQNDKQASEEAFKDTVMEIISETKIAYYNYLYYLEDYSIAKSSLERAQDLLKINKARYAKGLISSVDLLETETAVAQREKALISTESDHKKAEDALKLITNLVDDPEVWNAKLELIDEPEFNIQKINLVEAIKNSFELRPDYQSQKIDLKSRDIKIKVAKNALLPTVDLKGSFGLNGLDRDYERCMDKISKDYKDWSVGVEFEIPWGGEERATYDKRKLERLKALIAFKRLEQNIILEVRDKVREVDIQYRQVQAAKVLKEKETKNYEAQKERYAAGQISTHDMLDYQDKLSQAERDYIKALIDYNIAIINLEKSEGLTLAKNGVILEE